MYDIRQPPPRFSKWLLKLKDLQGKIAIAHRVGRMRKAILGIINLLVVIILLSCVLPEDSVIEFITL